MPRFREIEVEMLARPIAIGDIAPALEGEDRLGAAVAKFRHEALEIGDIIANSIEIRLGFHGLIRREMRPYGPVLTDYGEKKWG